MERIVLLNVKTKLRQHVWRIVKQLFRLISKGPWSLIQCALYRVRIRTVGQVFLMNPWSKFFFVQHFINNGTVSRSESFFFYDRYTESFFWSRIAHNSGGKMDTRNIFHHFFNPHSWQYSADIRNTFKSLSVRHTSHFSVTKDRGWHLSSWTPIIHIGHHTREHTHTDTPALGPGKWFPNLVIACLLLSVRQLFSQLSIPIIFSWITDFSEECLYLFLLEDMLGENSTRWPRSKSEFHEKIMNW